MDLRVRHGAGFEPAIEHILDAVIFLAIDFQHDLIDIRAMQIRHFHAAEFFDFFDAAADMDFAGGRFPDRDRRAPEAVARNAPIRRGLNAFAHLPGLHVIRNPVNRLVIRRHDFFDAAVAQRGHLRIDRDIPAAHRAVDQRRVGAPAMRVVVFYWFVFHQLIVSLQPAHNAHVGEAIFRDVFGGDVLGFVFVAHHNVGFGDAGVGDDDEALEFERRQGTPHQIA